MDLWQAGRRLALTGLFASVTDWIEVDIYSCPACGRLAFFRTNFLPQPKKHVPVEPEPTDVDTAAFYVPGTGELVKCPVCGKSLSHKEGYPRKSTNGTTYLSGEGFQCLGYMKGLHSGSQFISAKKLTDSVITSLRDVLESTTDVSFELVRTYEPTIELDCQRYQRELASLDRKLERIREAYMNEIDTLEDYKRNKEMIEKRRADLEALLADMTTAASGPENYKEQFLNRVQSVLDIIESDAPNDLKAEALRGIVRKIVFYKDTNTLEFHYYLMVE